MLKHQDAFAETDGTYTLEETEVEKQFIFFRNDHEVLGNVGTVPLELFSKYLIKRGKHGETYRGQIFYEFSTDGKTIRMTAYENPNLRIVKSKEKDIFSVIEPGPNIFKRIFRKLFGK